MSRRLGRLLDRRDLLAAVLDDLVVGLRSRARRRRRACSCRGSRAGRGHGHRRRGPCSPRRGSARSCAPWQATPRSPGSSSSFRSVARVSGGAYGAARALAYARVRASRDRGASPVRPRACGGAVRPRDSSSSSRHRSEGSRTSPMAARARLGLASAIAVAGTSTKRTMPSGIRNHELASSMKVGFACRQVAHVGAHEAGVRGRRAASRRSHMSGCSLFMWMTASRITVDHRPREWRVRPGTEVPVAAVSGSSRPDDLRTSGPAARYAGRRTAPSRAAAGA